MNQQVMRRALLFATVMAAATGGIQRSGADAPATSGEEAARLSLSLVVKQAAGANPLVVAMESRLRAAEERVPQSGALPDPMFTYRVEGVPLGGANFLNGPERRFMLTQGIPFPGKRDAERSVAGLDAESMRWELAGVRNDVSAEAAASYFDLHLVYARLAVLDQSQGLMRLLADLSRTRYQLGRAGQDDYLRGTLELSQETAQASEERARLRAATARLNLLLDRAPDAVLYPPEFQPAPAPTLDLAGLELLAQEIAPSVRARETEIARGEQQLTLARKEGRPDFSLGLGYMSLKNADDAWMGEFDMTLPIWRESKVSPRRREAEAALGAARAEREADKNDVLSAVEAAWARFSAAEIEVGRYRDTALPQAQLALASNRAMYEQGKGSFAALIESARDLLRYQLENEEALVEREKSLAELARAVGDMSLLLGEGHD